MVWGHWVEASPWLRLGFGTAGADSLEMGPGDAWMSGTLTLGFGTKISLNCEIKERPQSNDLIPSLMPGMLKD